MQRSSKSLKTVDFCRSLWIAGRRDSTLFGVVDDTTTTKFTSRACAVHCNSLPVFVDKVVVVVLKFPIVCKTLKKEGRTFTNIGKNIYIYIPDCKISLASFVLYFHLLLIRSFIRIRSFLFVSWSLLHKLNFETAFETLVRDSKTREISSL